jgi:hypothetical protein
MTASEMEDVLKTLDLRTSRIEQILPTLATKDDLKAFATKDDLKAFATKEDLKAYATREDLKALATKEELQAVKKELQEAIQEVDRHAKVMYESVKSDTQMIAEYVASMKGEAR